MALGNIVQDQLASCVALADNGLPENSDLG
jgi:hypothetical protein